MKFVGIVGHESAKFDGRTEPEARQAIRGCLKDAYAVVSGGCHLGGVDIWAEEEANALSIPTAIFLPKTHSWETGYKPRNIKIAELSDIVYIIVVEKYPADYRSMKFDYCYHCDTNTHIKSGGCWTGKYAQRIGRPAEWIVIR